MERPGLFEQRERLPRLGLLQMDEAEVVVGRHIVGIRLERLAELLRGQIQTASAKVMSTEIVARTPVGGIKLQRTEEILACFFCPASLVADEAEQVIDFRIPAVACHSPAQLFLGSLQVSRLDLSCSKCDAVKIGALGRRLHCD